ncbi:tyrosyl-DNA phosphodiesterase-domain-containing protein [Suillus fuscotomentosus]|uniref:Tyrosyl-DNA phosphodiesterase-domain-containing protein n=1 Tax=Suillus fuscotomentosus TaxID=1912939 RepID=A0AAD4DQQ1_9AGAM|nr:tyrosyl-DNA phosphodiesterase-domain-containing protein [Suillus fuscotomentosus]KAG1890452.1 tyrosyl-DNA phosphodiesterase-domain-containing protein [Suillus fuscotomentosus]
MQERDLYMDKDLERALALSLRESQVNASSSRAISISDSEDDDDDRFQSGRLQENRAFKTESSRATTQSVHYPAPPSQSARNTLAASFLSERAQMERERLERLKRLRGQDADDGGGISPPTKRQHIPSSEKHANGRANIASASSSSVPSGSSASSRTASTSINSTPTSEQLFWNGELRPTANKHSQPRQDGKPTFRLTEVLGSKPDISFAIIASYAMSVSWIYEFFAPSTPVIIVAQPDQSGQPTIKNILPNWVMTVPSLRNGRGCQHMKFMLIFYKTGRLRIVISTANLVDHDWRDIENAVWLQDLPPRSAPIPHDPKAIDDFPSIMQNVLRAVNVRPALANMLANDHPNLPLQTINDLRMKWDWSKVKVKLIPSIAGKHEGWPNVVLTGHTRLMKAVRDMGLRTGKGKAAKDLLIESQGSSIGTYSTQWVNEFYWSARGESAEDWLDESKARRAKLPWPPVKIVFPSLKTVRDSVLGELGGGTMFCRTNQWEASKFPRELFHDSNSTGGRVLMHTKMIIATYRPKKSIFETSSQSNGKGKELSDSETEPESDDIEIQNDPIGWAYVGSHNFTPSAWGTLSGSGFNPVLNVVNYELGIVFPLYDAKDAERVSCFKRPARKYVSGQDRPWIQEESQLLRQSQEM